jgi:hypothetical protein
MEAEELQLTGRVGLREPFLPPRYASRSRTRDNRKPRKLTSVMRQV